MSEARVQFQTGRRDARLAWARFVLRNPRLSRAASRAVYRLPRGRLRRALISELWRRGYEVWTSGGTEAIVHLLDPQIEWDLSNWADWPEDVYRGHDGFRKFWDDYLSVWEEVEFIIDEIIDAGDQMLCSCGSGLSGR